MHGGRLDMNQKSFVNQSKELAGFSTDHLTPVSVAQIITWKLRMYKRLARTTCMCSCCERSINPQGSISVRSGLGGRPLHYHCGMGFSRALDAVPQGGARCENWTLFS